MATIPQCKLAGGGQLVAINTQGIPGPVGPTGASGATGATGPTGPTGPGAVVLYASHPYAPGALTAGGYTVMSSTQFGTCAAGTKAINGWTVPFYFMQADDGMLQLDQAGPQLWSGVLGTSWQVDWFITRTNTGAVDIQTYLVCMP